LNPEWLVPDSIKEREFDPKLMDEPDYYEKHGYRLRTYGGGRELLIQEPGPGNALGRVKFLFRNDFGVYLHDTPSKRLFRKRRRLYSHGCVRVESALDLAAEILSRDQGTTWAQIKRALRRDRPTEVILARPIPIRLVYTLIDAWPGRRPRFLPDYYKQEQGK